MRNFRQFMAFMAICSLVFTSCSKEEDLTEGNSEKAVLSFGAVLNDLVLNRAALKQQLINIPECSDDVPAFVEIVLAQDQIPVVGTIANPLRVNVNPNPGDYDNDGITEYFTDESPSLELEPGSYTLEYFTVLNQDQEVIWISPIANDGNDNFSGFVNNPLPFEFSLNSGVKKYLDVEVLCYDNRMVNAYGYLFFEFEGTEAIQFCIFGNYCDEDGRHAEVAAYNVSVWTYSGDPATPQGEVLYTKIENPIIVTDYEDYAEYNTYPVCLALPDKAGLDEYYFEINLQSGIGYDTEERIIRSGVINDEDVRSLFIGDDNVDYYHFREGNCNLEDSPVLFQEFGNNLPTLIDHTTEENANLTFTSIMISGEVVGGTEFLHGGVLFSENPNPSLEGDRYYEYERTFTSMLSGLSPGTTYYYRLYAVTQSGTVLGEEKTFTTPSLAGTTWNFHFYHFNPDEVTWYADVTFYEDGSVFYTEPAEPGRYDSWGTWYIEGNSLYYDLLGDNDQTSYILTGTVDQNSMSGTYTFGDRNPTWFAELYQ